MKQQTMCSGEFDLKKLAKTLEFPDNLDDLDI